MAEAPRTLPKMAAYLAWLAALLGLVAVALHYHERGVFDWWQLVFSGLLLVVGVLWWRRRPAP